MAQTIDWPIQIGYGVDVGDVDGDGRPDILLADKKQFVWYRNPGPATSRDRQGAVGAPHRPWQKFVMAENLTEHDNVCITARDIDGDGKVEVAVGAQWNPSETTDPEKSGAIFYLIRPAEPTQKWEPVKIDLHHPTTHRMRWMKIGPRQFVLTVLPLHGLANENGEGVPVQLQVVTPPADLNARDSLWTSVFLDTGLHMTHNFDIGVLDYEVLAIAGREDVGSAWVSGGQWVTEPKSDIKHGAGEVRIGRIVGGSGMLATIEPMHGSHVVAYVASGRLQKRTVLDETLAEGHALAVADLLGRGSDQVVAGWRKPNAEGKVGMRMYVPLDEKYEQWKTYTIDDNTMACEDLKVADLDGDGKLDIVASGRATENVIVYWNRIQAPK